MIGSGEKGEGCSMIRDKIKAKIRESILGVPVEVEKSLTFSPTEYLAEVKDLQSKIKELKDRIHELEQKNQFLKSENERLKDSLGIEHVEPKRCENCGYTAVYPVYIRTDEVKRIGWLCLVCHNFEGD